MRISLITFLRLWTRYAETTARDSFAFNKVGALFFGIHRGTELSLVFLLIDFTNSIYTRTCNRDESCHVKPNAHDFEGVETFKGQFM